MTSGALLRFHVIGCLLLGAAGQLRPRRVGVGSLGEETGILNDENIGATKGAGLNGFGGSADDILSSLQNNPMLAGMMEANPELASMLADPSLMQEKMKEIVQLMNSPEGQSQMANAMEEMQSVLTDPEKLRQGLNQFASNPMLKGMADAVPELKQVLEDPELMEQSISQVQEMFKGMEGMDMAEGLKNMMGALGGIGADGDSAGHMDSIKKAAELLKRFASDGFDASSLAEKMGAMGEDENSDPLQNRVREQLESILASRGGETLDAEEF